MTIDESITYLKLESKKQSATIAEIKFQDDIQATAIASINDRIDVFENYISTQLAPLDEAVQAGGLVSELIEC
jgi:hypothetical protein